MLQTLKLESFRNLAAVDLEFSPKINYFFGKNGSGKSSLLEAVSLFGLGRSFRSSNIRQLLQKGGSYFRVCVTTNTGLEAVMFRRRENSASGSQQILLNGDAALNTADVVRCFPMQVLHPAAMGLFTDGPATRRQWFDWGVFHVKPSEFVASWRNYNRALKQRNFMIKQYGGRNGKEFDLLCDKIRPFDHLIAQHGEAIDDSRLQYYRDLSTEFHDVLVQSSDFAYEVMMEYCPGWQKPASLQQMLQQTLERDCQRGYTHVGVHRADIRFKTQGDDVAKVFSRGEQKVLIYALRLAQGYLLQKQINQPVIYLLDDIGSELDSEHLRFVMTLLDRLGAQVLITDIEDNSRLAKLCGDLDCKRFSVERGKVTEVV